jgi:SNF2 family DNA or RNA helicase
MAVTLTKDGDTLVVKMEGRWSDIVDAKDKVKEIPGRRWDPTNKAWVLPADPAIADRLLKTVRPDCDDETMAWLKQSMMSHEESLTSPLPDDVTDPLLIPWGHQRCDWQPAVVNDEKFTGALDYQRAAIEHLAKHGRGLLCDDMGLGKTFEAISAVEEYVLRNRQLDGTSPEGPRLVIAPASVLGGWSRELNRWLKDPRVQIIDGKSPSTRHDQLATAIENEMWTIVNWEQIRVKKEKIKAKLKGGGFRTKSYTWMKEPLFQYPAAHDWGLNLDEWGVAEHAQAEREFKKADPYWLAVIADEIHRAKNKDAAQTKGLHLIRGQIMYGLTGTPIMNSPDEIWSLLRWLWPDEYHERGASHSPGAIAYWPFYNLYVDFWEDHFGKKVITGVNNPDALRFALKGKVIRRLAKAGGRKRIYFDVPLTPKQQKLYTDAETAVWLEIEKEAKEGDTQALELVRAAAEGKSTTELMRIPNGAARFVRLQQVLENAALLGGDDESGMMDDFEQRFQDSRPDQWLVFCNYKQSCEILAERLRRKFGATVEIYNGDIPASHRTQIEDAYQRGEVDVIVATIGAAREGITLTAGHLQYWLSRAVVPAWNEQGESRQDRKGQQSLVRVYIPQPVDTVAPDKVAVINRLKEGIVRTILPQGVIQEETV